MKFAICNETYGDWPFERVCRDVAECGYDGIEVALSAIHEDPRQIDEERASELGALAQGLGLEIVGLHWLLAAPPGMHITTPNEQVRERTVAYMQHLAHLCAAMGGKVLVLGSPQQRNMIEGDTYEGAFERATLSCRAVAETAGALGVTLALEPLAPAYTTFLTHAAEAVRLIEAVDHQACRLHLDTLAMCSEEMAIADVITANSQYLTHFHANDRNLGGPGSGDVDFAPIAAALSQANYDGFVSVEVFDMSAGATNIARSSLEYLRQAWA